MLQAEGDAEAQEKQRRDMEADVKTNVENAQKKQSFTMIKSMLQETCSLSAYLC